MRVETVPLIAGVLIALVGLALLLDAWTPDETVVPRERRRRPRAERSRSGEGWLGLGVLAMAAAFLGRDSWAWSNVAVIAGAVALAIGAWLNRHYFAQGISNRGKMRRRPDDATAPLPGTPARTGSAPDVLRTGRITTDPSAQRGTGTDRPGAADRPAGADRPAAPECPATSDRPAAPDRAAAQGRPRYRIR